MNNQFDELTKQMAQSVTRRRALKKFGVGVAAAIAASLGIKNAAAAPRKQGYCEVFTNWGFGPVYFTGQCVDPTTCQKVASSHCNGKPHGTDSFIETCGGAIYPLDSSQACSF